MSAHVLDSLLEGDAYYQCPYPAFARLRDESPVHWHAASQSWLVARWDDAEAVLRAPRSYSSYGYQNAYFERLRPELRAEAQTLELRGRTPPLITSDPPRHTRLRRIINSQFTSDSGTGSADPAASFNASSTMKLTPMVFDGSRYVQQAQIIVEAQK